MSDQDRNDPPGGDRPPPPPPSGGGAPPPPPPSGGPSWPQDQGGQQGPPPGYGDQPSYGGQGYGGGYQDQGYGYAGPPKNGLGTAALVLGIISIPTAIFIFGGLLGILAVIFGFIGLSRVKKGQANNKGVALAGVITGFVGIVIAVIALIILVTNEDLGTFVDCVNEAETTAEREACEEEFEEDIGG